MSAPRELYLLDKNEVEKGMMLVKSPAFERLLVFALADFAAQNPSREETTGANRFIALLKSFPDDPGKPAEFPGSGLNHGDPAPLNYAVHGGNLTPT